MNTVEKAVEMENLRIRVQDIVDIVESYGYVVSVSQAPLKPLAMRNYKTIVEIRERQ